jgi:DNA ligase-1
MTYNPDEWDGSAPMPTLYSRTGTGATNVWRCWVQGAYVHVEWGQLDGAMQQGSFACAPKNTGRSNATTAEEQARLEAISKWKKQLKKKYSMTAEETKELNFAPMLAKSFEDRKGKVKYPVDVQPKFDGVRCLVHRDAEGNVRLMSRGKDPYDVAHIAEALDDYLGGDEVLDGELYIHGMKLQDIVSLVKRPQEGSKNLTYCVYDTISMRGIQLQEWRQRCARLHQWFDISRPQGLPSFIQMVQTVTVQSEEEVRYYHDEFVKLGYEGAIIRLPEGLYRFGYRSSELLKLKAFQDDEFAVIGVQPGKGKFANVPIFACVTKDGKKFDVVPKGTEQERYEMLCKAMTGYYDGRKLNVRFFAYTNDGLPQFPVGMYFREEGT